MSASNVVPLESNPDVLNKYLSKLGVSDAYQLVDVYGLDEDVLACVQKPVKAVVFLFPTTDIYESFRNKQNEALSGNPPPVPENLFFMKQYVQNACGTMALIHSIFNNLQAVELKDGSVIKNFYEKAKGMSPQERGKLLTEDANFINIHQDLAVEGQTNPPDATATITNHFIALVNVKDELFELDGSKDFPISHGSTNEDSFLSDAAKVCKEFMARDPKEVRFTIMALAKAE